MQARARKKRYDRWLTRAGAHAQPVPYLQLRGGPSTDLASAYKTGLSWKAILGQRSLARLRAHLISLTHKEGRESGAKWHICIWCDEDILGGDAFQALERCQAWTTARSRFHRARAGASPERLLRQLLATSPGGAGYEAGAEWARDIDASAARFWAGGR